MRMPDVEDELNQTHPQICPNCGRAGRWHVEDHNWIAAQTGWDGMSYSIYCHCGRDFGYPVSSIEAAIDKFTAPMLRPDGYVAQDHDRCEVCKKVFTLCEYDSPDQYYCWADDSLRPKCDSVAMEECIDADTLEERAVFRLAWEEWAGRRICSRDGWCPKFERRS